MEYEDVLSKENFLRIIDNKRQNLLEKKNELINTYFGFASLYKKDIAYNREKLILEYNHFLRKARSGLIDEIRVLDSVSPLKVLKRGYSIVSSGNSVISSVKNVNVGDVIDIRLSDGRVSAIISGKDDIYGE